MRASTGRLPAAGQWWHAQYARPRGSRASTVTSVLTRWRLHQHRERGERRRSLPRTSTPSPRQPRPPRPCTSALLTRRPFSLSFSVSCWPALVALNLRRHIKRTCCNRPCLRARPTTSVANRFRVLLVKRGIFSRYGQRYGKTGHPTNVTNQICEPSYWWARYKSNRKIWRWFAGGSHFSIGRPYSLSPLL